MTTSSTAVEDDIEQILVMHPPSLTKQRGPTTRISRNTCSTNDDDNPRQERGKNQEQNAKHKQISSLRTQVPPPPPPPPPPNEQDPGYLFWLFRFLETEDSPLQLIGESSYIFLLINIRRDIVLEMITWQHLQHRRRGDRHGSNDDNDDDNKHYNHPLNSFSSWRDSLRYASRQFVAWTPRKDGFCCIGVGRLAHCIIGWMVPIIQAWLLYLLWKNIDSRVVPDGTHGLETAEQVGVGIFLALELAPHIAQGFGLVLLPFYQKKYKDTDTEAERREKENFVRNEWVETKRSDTWCCWNNLTIMLVGLIELSIAGAAFWLGLESAFQQETFVVALLRITVALFVERLDEKVHRAWKLFATPWAYRMAKEAVSEFGITENEKGD